MICCDVQGPSCKVWYHGDCVGISKYRGKRMERDNVDFVCPVCSTAADTTQNILISNVTSRLDDSTELSTVDSASIPSDATPISICEDSTRPDEGVPELPLFTEISPASFLWNNTIEGSDFVDVVTMAYDEVAHWKKNLFIVPFGKVGKEFVQELSRLFRSYGEKTSLECIAFKAAMLFCGLLLQKPHRTSSSKDFINCLQRRLPLWKQGNIDELLCEGRTIQHRLLTTVPNVDRSERLTRSFVSHMLRGNVRAALALLDTMDHPGAPLHLSDPVSPDTPSWTVLDELKAKHPCGQPACKEALLPPSATVSSFHPVIFDALDGAAIRSAALRTKGAAGPSGVDAFCWRRLCTSFHRASDDLCASLALVARRLCTDMVDPKGLTAFVACRLIALDKCPGVRPIGVGEVVRRIVGKAVLATVKMDILEAAGPLQLCAGQDAGCEAAIHAMRSVFTDDTTEAVLLVDASNAFNSLNRQVALRNISVLCPSIATILINTYRGNVPLFIDGKQLFSSEGTTQGDPLAMAMYAISVIPLIDAIRDCSIRQAWFADDATAAGSLCGLYNWWSALSKLGPAYGYNVKPSKSWLIVKAEHHELAKKIFAGCGVGITVEGKRHLGAAIGSPTFVKHYMSEKVDYWVSCVRKLSVIAKIHPHVAYCAYTHGLVGKWTYFLRTLPDISDLLCSLELTIVKEFIPAVTGRCVSDLERDLLALPVRMGGLGLCDPSAVAGFEFNSSLKVASSLIQEIIEQRTHFRVTVVDSQKHAKADIISSRLQRLASKQSELTPLLPANLRRIVSLSSEKGASSWLSVLPIEEHGFALHKGAFRDALCLRYGWLPSGLPARCVCGQSFTVDHAMNCATGGFPTLRHNELRDFTAAAMSEVCHNVAIEPVLQPLSGEAFHYATANVEDEARLDVSAQGFWGDHHQRAFFDVRVFNPNAPSYRRTAVSSLYRKFERDKQRMYEQRIRDVEMGSFTPLVFSTFGGMGTAATTAYKRLASLLAARRNQGYGSVVSWIRCSTSFSLLRSAVTCLRGARSHRGSPVNIGALDLAITEGQVVPSH